MKFSYSKSASEINENARDYLTKHLTNKKEGLLLVDKLHEKLGNSVEGYPCWHPIIPTQGQRFQGFWPCVKSFYGQGIDHVVYFTRGFVSCPYGIENAQRLVDFANSKNGIHAYLLDTPLYSDDSFPVVVEAVLCRLENDGTLNSQDAIAWFVKEIIKPAPYCDVAETWDSLRGNILGYPHGSRSSMFLNKTTGDHMYKILSALNKSGVFGECYGDSGLPVNPKA